MLEDRLVARDCSYAIEVVVGFGVYEQRPNTIYLPLMTLNGHHRTAGAILNEPAALHRSASTTGEHHHHLVPAQIALTFVD